MNYQAAVTINAQYTGEPQVRKARDDFGGLSGTIKGLRGALGALGIAFAAKEILQFGKRIIDVGDQMNDLKQKTGIGIQALSDLKAAAEDGGMNLSSMEGALKKFSNTVGLAEGGSKKASAGFRALGISLKDASGQMKSTDALLFDVADAISQIPDGADKAAAMVALFGRSGADLIPVLNGGRDAIKGMGEQMSDEFAKQSDIFNDKLGALMRRAQGFGSVLLEKVLPYLSQFLDYLNRLSFSGGFAHLLPEKVEAAPKARTGRVDTRFLSGGDGEKQANKEADAVKRLIAERYELAQLRGLEARRLDMSEDAYKKQKIAIEETFKASKELASFKNSEERAAYEAATQAIIAEKHALVDLQAQQRQSFGAGAKEALRDYMSEISNVAAQSRSVFSAAFHGIEDNLARMVVTGKANFADLASSISQELAKIAIRQAIIRPIMGALGVGFAMGGIMTGDGPVPLRKYAGGGIARSPQMALFGEGSQPEAFVPLPDGRSIPVSMKGGGGTSVVINVNMGGGKDSSTQANNADGRKLGGELEAAVMSVIVKNKRPGGLLA